MLATYPHALKHLFDGALAFWVTQHLRWGSAAQFSKPLTHPPDDPFFQVKGFQEPRIAAFLRETTQAGGHAQKTHDTVPGHSGQGLVARFSAPESGLRHADHVHDAQDGLTRGTGDDFDH